MKLLQAVTKPQVWLTFLFTCFIVAVKYPFDFFWAKFDVYYHAVHSQAYIDHFDVTFPAFSYLSVYPADLWYFYHLSIAVVYCLGNLFWSLNAEQAVFSIHIFYSAALCWTLLHFLKEIYCFVHNKRSISTWWYIALLTILTLCFHLFVVRGFFYERPHVLMIMLVLVGMIAVVKKRYHWLFIVAMLAPLTYSFSLFIFIPLVTLVLGIAFEAKSLLIRSDELDKVLFMSISGYVAGALLHPDTLGYLISGPGFHSFAILQSALPGLPTQMGRLVVPEEMTLLRDSFPIFHSLVAAGLLLALDLKKSLFSSKDTEAARKSTIFSGLILMSLGLLFASIFITRAQEYAIPFAVVSFLVSLPLFFDECKRATAASLHNDGSKMARFIRRIKSITQSISTSKVRQALLTLTASLAYVVLVNLIYGGYSQLLSDDRKDYRVAAEFLQSVATPDEVILQSQFATYPSLLRTAPELHYSIGMDARMIYFYNPELSYLYSAFFKTGECFKSCPYTREEALAKLRERYDINFVFVEENFMDAQTFVGFDNDERYELVFVDPTDDKIKVYKIQK